MGIKRLLLVLLILLVVVGLLILLFLQSGADERLIKSFIPRIEERLGVEMEYESVHTSLTSVAFDNVQVFPKGGEKPLVSLERLGVGFRVGPLLLGELDLTGIRFEGLKVTLGEAAGGPSLSEWRELAHKAADRAGSPDVPGSGSSGIAMPDVHLVTGNLMFDDGRFKIVLEGISGRLSTDGKAVIKFEDYRIVRAGRSLFFGDKGELRYGIDDGVTRLDLDKPRFEVIADADETLAIYNDADRTLNEFRGEFRTEDGGVGDRVDASVGEDTDDSFPLMVAINEASGVIKGGAQNEIELHMEEISAELSLNSGGLSLLRGTGGLPGTDARWTLGFHRSLEGEPTVSLEIPDLPLKKAGLLISDTEHIDWSGSSIDGAVTMVLSTRGRTISFEGQTAVSGLVVEHERLGPVPLKNLDVHMDFKATYNKDNKSVHLERLLLSRGLARVTLRGTLHHERLAFDLTANVPPTACRQIMGAVPKELRPRLQGLQLEGRFALDMRLAVDEDKPEETVLETDMQNDCRVSDWGSVPEPDEFRRPFSYMAYSDEGDRIRLVTGPGTDRWTPYSMISPYLIEAVLTTEDGKFRRHSGMTIPEIRRAIELNLKKGSLRHGASTITMQLAKNLFLSRDRTVARKAQELFFTWYLETNFTKDTLLELYFNVIEFGPSIYGIKEAANHYFGREPHELNQIESVFLIKLLPNPVDRHSTYVKGQVSDRKMNSLRKVLATMLARGRITPDEYQEALDQQLIFYYEGDPLPEPRTPVMRDGFGLSSSNESFEEVEESDDEEWGEP